MNSGIKKLHAAQCQIIFGIDGYLLRERSVVVSLALKRECIFTRFGWDGGSNIFAVFIDDFSNFEFRAGVQAQLLRRVF